MSGNSQLPGYPKRPHKTGAARVYYDGKDYYFGRHGTDDSLDTFNRWWKLLLVEGEPRPVAEVREILAAEREALGSGAPTPPIKAIRKQPPRPSKMFAVLLAISTTGCVVLAVILATVVWSYVALRNQVAANGSSPETDQRLIKLLEESEARISESKPENKPETMYRGPYFPGPPLNAGELVARKSAISSYNNLMDRIATRESIDAMRQQDAESRSKRSYKATGASLEKAYAMVQTLYDIRATDQKKELFDKYREEKRNLDDFSYAIGSSPSDIAYAVTTAITICNGFALDLWKSLRHPGHWRTPNITKIFRASPL